MNMGTAPTRHVLIVQPLRVFKTPEDGVGAQAAPPFDNLDGTVGVTEPPSEMRGPFSRIRIG
jgi:hypothetical protein